MPKITSVTISAFGMTRVRMITRMGCAMRVMSCDPFKKTNRSLAVMAAMLMVLFIVTTVFIPSTTSIAEHSSSCNAVNADW